MKLPKKPNKYIYELIIILIIAFHYGGILYTDSFLAGAEISDFVNLRLDTIQTAAFRSANLPVFYLFDFLYSTLGFSSGSIKAGIAFFCLAAIVFSIYRISFYVFNSKLSGILSVILFLYSSLYFNVHFDDISFIDESNPTALSFAFLMLGILCWVMERFKLSSICMGLSFNCHPILPIGFIASFFVYQLIDIKRIKVKSLIATLVLFVIVTLPVTLGIVKSSIFVVKTNVQGLDAELIWNYVKLAQPQTAFIDIIPPFHYGLSLYFASFLLLLLLYVHGDNAQKKKYLKLFILVFTVFIFTLFELLNSYYFKIIYLYNLWFFRFMSYGSTVVYIILAGSAFYNINENRNNNFLRTCIFILLSFSVFGRAYQFYILEVVMIYYSYNIYINNNLKLSFKNSAINLIFSAGTLIYFYYITIYDKYNQQFSFFDMFKLDAHKQWTNIKLFLKVVLYRQFRYAREDNGRVYIEQYILLLCFILLGIIYMLKPSVNKNISRTDR